MNMIAYADSYRRAAENLFDAHVAKRRTDNFLIFPLGLLWRHYVEVSLKSLLAMIPDDGAGRERGEFPNGHSLLALWGPVASYLRARFRGSKENQHVDRVIRSLDSADPDGDGFRYPVASKRRDRKDTLAAVPPTVDLVEFDRSMRSIGNFIDGTVAMLIAEWDAVPDESESY